MSALRSFLNSSIGQKTLMALTGLALIGFLIMHLAGNLTLFSGAEALNAYEEKLMSFGPLLYVAEIGLLALFVVHIGLALRVSARNREARGDQGYRFRNTMGQATTASRSMVITGLVVLVFLIIHLIDFRISKAIGGAAAEDMGQAAIDRLSHPLGAFIYIVAMGALGLHLRHAFASALQTLGLRHPRYATLIQGAGLGLAVVLALGFASIPIYLLLTGGGAH